MRKFFRKFSNFCITIKSAISEVVNLLLSQARKNSTGIMQSQGGRIDKIKNDMFGNFSPSSFNTLLEKRIGSIVIVEIQESEGVVEYHGVLKEYSSDFFEIMDVDFDLRGVVKKSDLIVPRNNSIVRHLGE